MHFRQASEDMTHGRTGRASRELGAAAQFICVRDRELARLLHSSLLDVAVDQRDQSKSVSKDFTIELLEALDSTQLAPLSQGLATLARFTLARRARERALSSSLRECASHDCAEPTVRRAVHHLVDQGDVEGAIELARRLAIRGALPPRNIYSALHAIRPDCHSKPEALTRTIDSTFADLITGRDVLLVGAAPSTDPDNLDEEAYDCIVRMTPAITFRQTSEASRRRCDVAYLTTISAMTARGFEQKLNGRTLSLASCTTPALIVMKNAEHLASLGHVPIRSVGNVRSGAIGSPTSGTQAIVDILQFGPRTLHLVGFNFYTSAMPYRPEILEQKRTDPAISGAGRDFEWNGTTLSRRIHSIQWAAHDLASDFMLVRAITRHNSTVTAIGGTSDVLLWRLEDYYSRFDQLCRQEE
jgi:hypothetical protein